jgi:hypothetical protein
MPHDNEKKGSDELELLVRNNYFPGKLMTARDFEAEQLYFSRKHELGLRFVVGGGVVCGLNLAKEFEYVVKENAVRFGVSPGFAIDPYGREILVPDGGMAAAAEMPLQSEEFKEGDGATLRLYILFGEEEYEPVPAFDRDEPCWGEQANNRTREKPSFELERAEESSGEKDTDRDPARAAEEYFARESAACEPPERPGVFLSELMATKEGDGWKIEVAGNSPRQLVYTNPMLYSLVEGLASYRIHSDRWEVENIAADGEKSEKSKSFRVDVDAKADVVCVILSYEVEGAGKGKKGRLYVGDYKYDPESGQPADHPIKLAGCLDREADKRKNNFHLYLKSGEKFKKVVVRYMVIERRS